MTEKKKVKSARLNVVIAEGLVGHLAALKRETHATSLCDVVRSAITAYCALHEYHKQKAEIVVRMPDGKEKELVLFL